MDQARWMIVFSVVICMVLTLAMLQRFVPAPAEVEQQQETVVENVERVVTPAAAEDQPRMSVNYGEIRYPEPPAHVFSIGDSAESAKEAEMIVDDGKILQ